MEEGHRNLLSTARFPQIANGKEKYVHLKCSHYTDPENQEISCISCGEVLGYDHSAAASGRDIGMEQKTRKPVPDIVNGVLGTDLVSNAKEIYGAKLPFIRKETANFKRMIKRKGKQYLCSFCKKTVFELRETKTTEERQAQRQEVANAVHEHGLRHAYDMVPVDINQAMINRLKSSERVEKARNPDLSIKQLMNDYASDFLQKLPSFQNPQNSHQVGQMVAKHIHSTATTQLSWILFAHPKEVISEFEKYGNDTLALRVLASAHEAFWKERVKEEGNNAI